MTQKRCEEAHLAAIASEAVQVSVIAIVLCKSIVASRSWYRLVAPENVPLRVSLSETAPGVVSGVSLVDVFRSYAPWLRLLTVS